MRRGDLYWADVPGGRRPVVVVTRTAALPHLREILVAPITSTRRAVESHVRLDEHHGLEHASYVNCDALVLVRAAELLEPISSLDDESLARLDAGLRFALGLEARDA